jgi:hypothetical protein
VCTPHDILGPASHPANIFDKPPLVPAAPRGNYTVPVEGIIKKGRKRERGEGGKEGKRKKKGKKKKEGRKEENKSFNGSTNDVQHRKVLVRKYILLSK